MNYSKMNTICNATAVIILLTIGILYLLSYFVRKREKNEIYNLYFSLLNISISFVVIIQELSYKYLNKAYPFLLCTAALFCWIFGFSFNSYIINFPYNKYNKKIILFCISLILASILFTVTYFINSGFYTKYSHIIPILVSLSFFIALLIQIHWIVRNKESIRKKKEIKYISIGAIFICLSIVSKVLIKIFIINNYLILHNYFDIIVVSFIFTYVLLKRSGSEFLELCDIKTTLEQKVADRTHQLEEANRQKTDFFINLAHETKTPLTLVSNYFDDYIKKTGHDRSLDIVKSNIDKMKRDIVNFFDLEKLMSGKIFYDNSRTVNFSKLLEEKILLFETAKSGKDIIFKTNIEKDLYLKIDPYALDRIVNNMMDNAIRYSGKGIIKINLKTRDDRINFSIEDNGIGISPDKIPHIFEPYYQISNVKENYQGIGLGLSIVKKIIDSVNGEIHVESRVNEGTCFTLVFEKSVDSNMTDETSISKPARIMEVSVKDDSFIEGRRNIMIVEDNADLLNFIHDNISKEYNIFTAVDGRQALEKLESIPIPDVIVSDIMMSEMDGYEFRGRLLDNDKYKDIPFIFLTAKTLDDEKVKGLKTGAIDYITKPFKIDELGLKIQTLMDIKSKFENEIQKYRRLFDKSDNSSGQRSFEEIFEKKCNDSGITERQKDIIKELLRGMETKEIADLLKISTRTVSNHIQDIYIKLKINNKMQLLMFFKNCIRHDE